MADVQQTINDLAMTVKKYVEDAATLTVTTSGVRSVNGQEAKQVIAKTVLSLDGDATYDIPIREDGGRLVPETDLLELHERSVKAATDYRAQLLGSFVQALGTLIRPNS